MVAIDAPGGWLTAEAILAAQDIPEADVATPEWGPPGLVHVRGLTMAEVLAIRKAVGQDERLVVIHTLATAFTHPELTIDQAEALLSKSGNVCQRVLKAVNGLNGMGEGGPEVPAAQRAFPDAPGNAPGPDAGASPGPDQG